MTSDSETLKLKVARLLYRGIGDEGRRRLGRFPPFRQAFYAIAPWLNGNDDRVLQCRLGGNRMYIPADFYGFSLLGEYESETTRAFEQSIQAGDVVVDIGAHVGYFSLLAARLVEDSGQVVSFEPLPSNFDLLVKNIRLSGFNNIAPFNKAVASSSGTATLFVRGSCTSTLSGATGDSKYRSTIECETVCLDDFFRENPSLGPRLKLIKMDIEGGEMLALHGMQRLVNESAELTLIIEYNPMFISQAGGDPVGFLRYIERLGFSIGKVGEARYTNAHRFLGSIPWGSGINLICRKHR